MIGEVQNLEFLTDAIQTYGLLAVFVLILLEYACFPLPSEIVLPFSGALAVQNDWGFLTILLFSVVAGILGSFICYLIGYFGGCRMIDAVKRKFPKTKRGLDASQRKYEQYAAFSSGVGRLIPLCRTYISFIAGACRQNMFSYLLSTAIGVTIWNAILVGLGYFFVDNWNIVSEYYDQYKIIVLIVVCLAIGFIVFRFIRKHFIRTAKKRKNQIS